MELTVEQLVKDRETTRQEVSALKIEFSELREELRDSLMQINNGINTLAAKACPAPGACLELKNGLQESLGRVQKAEARLSELTQDREVIKTTWKAVGILLAFISLVAGASLGVWKVVEAIWNHRVP